MSVSRDEERGTYYVQCWYRDWTGQRKKKTKRGFKTKKAAAAWEVDFLRQMEGTPDMTLKAFYELYQRDLEKKLRITTQRNKQQIIETKVLPYLGERKLTEITPLDILSWQNAIQSLKTSNGLPYKDSYLRTVSNQLYKEFLRVLEAKAPKYFLAENVKGILSLGKGEVIKAIVKDFENVGPGYKVVYKLLNAANYGVPQTRQRVIIVGVRSDLDVDFEYPEPTNSKTGEGGLPAWVSVSQAIGHFPDPDEPNDVPNHVYSKYKVKVRNFTGHRQTDPDKPSPTILARGNGGGGVCAIPHYNGLRRMTIRESASVQTFPEDFVFVGKLNSCYRQIGNAVPVKLAFEIGKQFK